MLCSFKLAAFILKIPLELCTRVFNNFTVKWTWWSICKYDILQHAWTHWVSTEQGRDLLSTANLNFWNWYFSLTIKSWRLPGNSILNLSSSPSCTYIFFCNVNLAFTPNIYNYFQTICLEEVTSWYSRHSSVFFVVKLETITIKIYLRGNNESRRFKDV